jgi:hypothetical protein
MAFVVQMASLKSALSFIAVILVFEQAALAQGNAWVIAPIDDPMLNATLGPPAWPKGAKVRLSGPKEWTAKIHTFEIEFVPTSGDGAKPWRRLSVAVNGASKWSQMTASDDWRNSAAMVELNEFGTVRETAKVGSAVYQGEKLPIWRIRSSAYDMYLVLVRQHNLTVSVWLSGEDADQIASYLSTLREVVRSIRFMIPRQDN